VFPNQGQGIRIPLVATLAVMGLGPAAPVIDCEGMGRAFTYGFQFGGAGDGALVGPGPVAPQLVLDGLVVRNGQGSRPENSGGAVWAGGALVLRRCAFESCNAYSQGGAVLVDGAALLAEDVNFTDCTGGGEASGMASAVAVLFANSPVTNVTIALLACSFVGTTRGGGPHYTGGSGVGVLFQSPATNVTIVLHACIFVNTTRSEGIRDGGGGVLVHFDSPTTDVTISIANSSFTGCSAWKGGGAVTVTHAAVATGSATVVTGSNFSENTAIGGGGALALSAPAGSTAVSLLVEMSDFCDNAANGPGSSGGAVSIVFPEEAPQNLNFVSSWLDHDDDPCSGCSSFPDCSNCPEFNFAGKFPVIPRQHVFRRWNYRASNNTFVLRDSRFTGNVASVSGGALAAPGGGAGLIERCFVEGNSVTTLFGGGASLGGTVTLQVTGSHFAHNMGKQGGSQIYSSSGADIAFAGGSSVELGCGNSSGGSNDSSCVTGLSAVQSGSWTWDASSGMSCKPGFELVNSSVLAYSTMLDDWQLKAPIVSKCGPDVVVVKNVTNCPCYSATNCTASAAPPSSALRCWSQRCRMCAAPAPRAATVSRHPVSVEVPLLTRRARPARTAAIAAAVAKSQRCPASGAATAAAATAALCC
jgi:hypothetical protein